MAADLRTPDFDSYPLDATVEQAATDGKIVTVTWADGYQSRYHALWLRDNCAAERTLNPTTREQLYLLDELPEELNAGSVRAEDGALVVHWQPEDYESRYHPGWLRRNTYDGSVPTMTADSGLEYWDASFVSRVPTFDGPTVLDDDQALHDWVKAITDTGLGLLRNLPVEEDTVGKAANRIGPIRNSNFGPYFNVRVEADRSGDDSLAYTTFALPLHTDLPARELQPGVQMLFCMANDATGGDSIFTDGFRVADDLRHEDPETFRILTETRWTWKYHTKSTEYRQDGPVIDLNPDGSFKEIRIAVYQRGTLSVPFDQMEAAYAALIKWLRLVKDTKYVVQFRLEPGDLIAFDNRRMLHARSEFDLQSGTRHLRGCYVERDDLYSRLRVTSRG